MDVRITLHGDAHMKHHIDGEVKWVWIITTVLILYVAGMYGFG
jgi:hypothetical protein